MKDRIFMVLCLMYVASLFTPASPVMMGLLAGYSLYLSGWRQKLILLKQRPWLYFIFAFSAWMLVSALTSTNQHSAWRVIELRLPLLIFPFTLGLVQITPELRNRIFLGIATITTIACLVSTGFAIYQYTSTGLNFWLYNDSISYLIGQQSIYTSLLVNLSVFIFIAFITISDAYRKYRPYMAVASILLLVISYMLASRNMMILLYSMLLLFLVVITFRRKLYLEGATILMALVIGAVAIVKIFPNTINRFRELGMTTYNYQGGLRESHYDDTLTAEQWNGANFRLAAWPIGWEIFKDHPISGVGIGDKRDELLSGYKRRNFHFAIATNKNVHNNYLDLLLSTGLVGFLLFVTGWLMLPLISFVRQRDPAGLVVVVILAAAMLTENYFDRNLGSAMFSFLVLFSLLAAAPKNRSF